jgi:hypothetical protein
MDMNNPVILDWYTRLVAFSADKTQGDIVFLDVTPKHRDCIYRLAKFVGLVGQVLESRNEHTIEFQKIRQAYSPNDLTTSHNLRSAKSFTQDFNQNSLLDSSNSRYGYMRRNSPSIDQLNGAVLSLLLSK